MHWFWAILMIPRQTAEPARVTTRLQGIVSGTCSTYGLTIHVLQVSRCMEKPARIMYKRTSGRVTLLRSHLNKPRLRLIFLGVLATCLTYSSAIITYQDKRRCRSVRHRR